MALKAQLKASFTQEIQPKYSSNNRAYVSGFFGRLKPPSFASELSVVTLS